MSARSAAISCSRSERVGFSGPGRFLIRERMRGWGSGWPSRSVAQAAAPMNVPRPHQASGASCPDPTPDSSESRQRPAFFEFRPGIPRGLARRTCNALIAAREPALGNGRTIHM